MTVLHSNVPSTVDGTAVWDALVGGRWGIHDLGRVDGRQAYALFEVPQDQRLRRRLSPLEARVLHSCTGSVLAKQVAVKLRLPQSTVSMAMRSAGTKFGLGSRAALIQLATHLLGTQLIAPTHLLTSAESDILRHLALGRKNSQIAASRGSSMRTVANQVASVLRKLGLPSRAGAAALSIFQPAVSTHLVNASAVA